MTWFIRKDMRSECGVLLTYSHAYRRLVPRCLITKEEHEKIHHPERWIELTPELIRYNHWKNWIEGIEWMDRNM